MTAGNAKTLSLVNPEVFSKGGMIAKALLEGGSGGWSTLVGKNVSYNMGEADYGFPDEEFKDQDRGNWVVTPVDWSGDNSGKVFLLVSTAGAKTIVAYMTALMLGGEANPAETQLDADGMDAYSEAVNSFFGQGAQQARGEVGGTIKTAVDATTLADFAKTSPNSILGHEDMLCFRVAVFIEGNPPFDSFLLMTRSVTGVPPDAENSASPETTAASAEKLGVNPKNLDTVMTIKLPVIVTIASKKMRMELIQDMNPGTILEFRKMSKEPLDVMAGNVKIAEAEVVITNQCFGVQINAVIDPRALPAK